MCKVENKITDRSLIRKGVTGYKAVLKNADGTYSSPSTGILYQVGKVKQPTKRQIINALCRSGWANPMNRMHYSKEMHELHLTGVALNLEELKYNMGHNNKYTYLKMTVRRNLHNGTFNINVPIVLGSYIVSIEELKD